MVCLDENLKTSQICLVLSPPEKLRENNMELIKKITEYDGDIILITVSQPAQYLYELYSAKGVDINRLTFIDTITRFAMGKAESTIPRCRFLNHPSDLTSLSIAVSETLKETSAKKPSIIIDSINAMLIYLPSADITRFMHFISSKLRIMSLSGIYLAAESSLDPAIMAQIVSFTDRVINLENGETL